MTNRRRKSVILLMATSVFLCLLASCGIPTYLVPSKAEAVNVSSSGNSTTFNVIYNGDSVGEYGKVGLLLVYYLDSGEKIDSNETTEFNPDLHDAIMVEGEGEKEVISETLRPGYYYQKEVLRPAMVKVRRIS